MVKSFIIAIIGLFIAYVGINLILTGIGVTFLSAWLTALGFNTSFLTTLSVGGVILGIAATYFGSKIYFENEEKLATLILGILGLLLTLSGASIALGSGGSALLIGLIVISIGLSFIGYAFKIRPLEPLTQITTSYKKLLGVNR